jgi:phospholipase/lecithinase/hemolysin
VINTGSLKRWTLASLLAVACAVPQLVFAQASFKRIVVFGTSLSDPGNAFALYGGTNTPPSYEVDDFLVPPPQAPYARGGHHFSNGATWIEQFARPLGLAGSVRPALRGANRGATNYAVGGARAREDGLNFNLSAQVHAFLGHFNGAAPSDALYVIEMGGNDVRDAIGAYVTAGPSAAGMVIGEALGYIAHNIGLLSAAGATNFVVLNVPDLAVTPAIRTLDTFRPGAAILAAQLTQAFNDGLDGVVAGLPRFDIKQRVNDLIADPARFGLTNVNTACITRNAPFHCQNFDEYLFWDGVHPTAAVHAIIAQFAAAALLSGSVSVR